MNSVNLPKSAKWTKIAMNVIGGFFFNFCKLSGTMLLSKAATCSKPCKAHYLRWDLHTLLMTEQSLMWAWVWTLLQSPVLSLVQNYRLEQTGTTHIRNSNKSWKKKKFWEHYNSDLGDNLSNSLLVQSGALSYIWRKCSETKPLRTHSIKENTMASVPSNIVLGNVL